MFSPSLLAKPWAICRRDPARALNVAALTLFGFSIPISPHWVSITTALVLLVWLARRRFQRFPAIVAHNPVARAATLLFGLLVVGVAYSPIEFSDSLYILKKYRELILIPILMSLADTQEERNIAILGFMAAMLLSLALAYGEWFRLFNIGRRMEPSAFQHRIIFSIFLSYFLFWAAHRAFDGSGLWRWFWVAIVVAGAIFSFYAIGSRTGYLVFALLALLCAIQRLTLKRAAIATLGLAALLVPFFFTSDIFSRRVSSAVESLLTYETGQKGGSTRSRLEQWRVTLAAIRHSPIIGHGTGSLGYAISQYSERKGYRGKQPHSEYLLIGVQLGVVGVAAFLWLFFTQWRAAGRAPPPRSYLGEGLVVTMAAACLVNSSLLNSPEGHLFGFMSAMLFAGPASQPGENGSM